MMEIKGYTTYFGGKGSMGAHQFVINRIPPHDVFISACLGMCYILRKLYPPELSIGLDKDPAIIKAWEESEHDRNLELHHVDMVPFLSNYQFDLYKTYVVYMDWPYHFATRKGKRKVYKHEWTPMDHQIGLDLAIWLTETYSNVYVVIQHYPMEWYDRVLVQNAGWHFEDYQARTRRGMATERLYMNYPPPDSLHDYRYVGKDYREREAIGKLKKEWTKQFNRMVPEERMMLLQLISSHNWEVKTEATKGYLALLQEKDPRVRKGIIQHLQMEFPHALTTPQILQPQAV